MARIEPYEEREYVNEARARLTLAGRVDQIEQRLDEMAKHMLQSREHAEGNDARIERLETETGINQPKRA